MKKTGMLLLGFLCLGAYAERETTSFNEGWRFARFGAMPDGAVRTEVQGLESPCSVVKFVTISLDLARP